MTKHKVKPKAKRQQAADDASLLKEVPCEPATKELKNQEALGNTALQDIKEEVRALADVLDHATYCDDSLIERAARLDFRLAEVYSDVAFDIETIDKGHSRPRKKKNLTDDELRMKTYISRAMFILGDIIRSRRPTETCAGDLRRLSDRIEKLLGPVDPVNGDGTSVEKIRTNGNRVPWDEKDPNFYENKKAVDEAVKVGHEHDVEELKNLDFDKLRKLLRKPACTIKYMSVKSPRPRGRINKIEWRKYLKNQIKQALKTEEAAEQKVRERMQ